MWMADLPSESWEDRNMRIAIGSDHGAYLLKNKVADHLRKAGYEVVDFGTNGP